jgi:hypothetical protein
MTSDVAFIGKEKATSWPAVLVPVADVLAVWLATVKVILLELVAEHYHHHNGYDANLHAMS